MRSGPSLGVISLFNTPAGLFRWWEEFPIRITALLQDEGIEHVTGYKSYLANSIVPPERQLSAHDETEVPHRQWVDQVLAPIASRFDRVIIHTHSYDFPGAAVWRLTVGRRNRAWWATHHATPMHRGGLRTVARRTLQRCRVLIPDRHFGCSEIAASAWRHMVLPRSVGALVNGRLSDADLAHFPVRDQPHRALFVGRLTPAKGVWALLSAGAELAATVPAFALTIVGSGPEEAALQQWIAERGLGARIRMAGYHTDVRPFYEAADFVIVPTDPAMYGEGLPLVALEAKIPALPVIYSLSGGLPETQRINETGILVDPPNAENIVAAARALMLDLPRYHAMRDAIREERVRWHIDAMAKAYVTQYVQVLRETSSLAR